MKKRKSEWEGWDFDEVYDYFMDLDTGEKVDMVRELMEDPNAGDFEVESLLGEVVSELVFADKADEAESLVEDFRRIFPGEYEKDFVFTEKSLISYYLVRGFPEKAAARLEYVRRDPILGIDNLTLEAYFHLIFRGHTTLALDYARDIWKTVRDSKEVHGIVHAFLCQGIYLDGLEDMWVRFRQGEELDWNDFSRRMEEYDVDPSINEFERIANWLEHPLDGEELERLKRDDDHAGLSFMLNIEFLRFMKESYDVPFMLSDLWWNILGDGKVFGKGEDFFYTGFDALEERCSSLTDTLFSSNHLEMFGRVFGLKYAFHFLHEYGLMGDEAYKRMKANLSALEYLYERLTYEDLWKMDFVFSWPQLDKPDDLQQGVWRSTFALYESDFELELDRYLNDRHNAFPAQLVEPLDAALGPDLDDFF